MKLKIEKSGDDLLLAIPAELIQMLQWDHGDIIDGGIEDGAIKLVRVQTAHERAMQIARKAMKQYKSAFETLAKS